MEKMIRMRHECASSFIKALGLSWRYILAFVIPLALLPLLMVIQTPEAKCAYVFLWMSSYWMVEAIPLPMTALLPVVLFPLLGIMDTQLTGSLYMQDFVMFLISSIIIGIALELTDIHERMAIKMLIWIGTSYKRVMFSVMLSTLLMSMWINNASAVLLICPTVDIIFELLAPYEENRQGTSNSDLKPEEIIVNKPVNYMQQRKQSKVLEEIFSMENPSMYMYEDPNNQSQGNAGGIQKRLILLGLLYAGNIGGTATPSGSAFPRLYSSLLQKMFPGAPEITYADWAIYHIPLCFICVVGGFITMQLIYWKDMSKQQDERMQERLSMELQKKYQNMGPVKLPDLVIVLLFFIQVFLCITKETGDGKGWGKWIPLRVQEATPVTAAALMLFILPRSVDSSKGWQPLVTWTEVNTRMPWNMIIVIGGGFALAEGALVSGLAVCISKSLHVLQGLHPVLVQFILCLVTSVMTEMMGNVVIIFVLLPIVGQLATALHVHPSYFMLPVTVASCFAFMLPIACGTNLLIYTRNKMKVWHMIKPGLIMNAVCILMNILMINLVGTWFYELQEYPEWAEIPSDIRNTTLQTNSSVY